MHSDFGVSYVHAGMGSYMFYHNRRLKKIVGGEGGCPSCVKGRNYGHLFKAVFFLRFLFDNEGSVYVFAALNRQKDSLRFKD